MARDKGGFRCTALTFCTGIAGCGTRWRSSRPPGREMRCHLLGSGSGNRLVPRKPWLCRFLGVSRVVGCHPGARVRGIGALLPGQPGCRNLQCRQPSWKQLCLLYNGGHSKVAAEFHELQRVLRERRGRSGTSGNPNFSAITQSECIDQGYGLGCLPTSCRQGSPYRD